MSHPGGYVRLLEELMRCHALLLVLREALPVALTGRGRPRRGIGFALLWSVPRRLASSPETAG